jgi:lysyl-tRNA synthetase class 2
MDERQRLARLKPDLQRRDLIYQLTRAFFHKQGFLEVETPIRVPVVAPEQHIVPIRADGWFLSTSPELHMKRLLAAGYDKLFQTSRSFRKGERGRQHNPEFTMLEWYRAGADYMQMIRDTEELVLSIAEGLKLRHHVLSYQGQSIDLNVPWHRVTVRDAFRHTAGWDPVKILDPPRFDTDLVTKVIPGFPKDRPTVIYDYPAAMASLARLKQSNPSVAERAEVFIGGLELANAYSELRNVAEQEKRFQAEIELIEQEQGWRPSLPRRFMEALPHLPECGGIALGMDRLVMLFCDAGSIDDVMPFTVDTA